MPWLRRAAWLGRLAVGAVLLLAGGIKALDPVGFSLEIDAYGWLPEGLTHPAAIFFIAVELLLGAALVLQARPRLAAWGTAALLLLFVGVLGEAWAAGRQLPGCGCFGGLVERTPGQALVEDLLLLAALVPTLLCGRLPEGAPWRAAVAAGLSAAGLGLAVAAPSLPLDDLVTDLRPGQAVAKIGLDALVPEKGAVLMALLDLDGAPSQAAVPALNEVARSLPEVTVTGLAAADPEARALFGWTHGAGFPVDEIGAGTVRSLARALPRFALLVDGTVVAVWTGNPPAPAVLREALEGAES
jgi:uncharacterized membrane protein YphA (DoxX/SURF4 family)